MAKRSKRKRSDSKPLSLSDDSVQSAYRTAPATDWAWPSTLALVAFIAYIPSLGSDFVYDARKEILEEGFLTSLSNLPTVLSLKVLGMNLILGSRPGQLLYLMLIAAFCGTHPFGYHLASNLLHAANVVLLFTFLLAMAKNELRGLIGGEGRKIQFAVAAVTLIFALHPIATESVSEVSYSSSLLVTFFTLLALNLAMAFCSEKGRSAFVIGTFGALSTFAAVACKESGIVAAFLLVVYWFLYRRNESKRPWMIFLGSSAIVSLVFLAARFLLAPPSLIKASFLGGSLGQMFAIQPRIWVFMMGRLIWPTQLSADYTLHEAGVPSLTVAILVLAAVIGSQVWLAWRSRLGAFGVATYWSGLATVSNFIPLYHAVADRYYYLPLAGVVMQMLALLLLSLRWPESFFAGRMLCLAALMPLTVLTVHRQAVFANESTLWASTIEVSPLSPTAHYNLGNALLQKGRMGDAMTEFQRAIELDPHLAEAHYNLGTALALQGRYDEAAIEFQKTLEINPAHAKAHDNYGSLLFRTQQLDAAIDQFQKAVQIEPTFAEAHDNLGYAFYRKGDVDAALDQFQQAAKINPGSAEAFNNIGYVLLQKGQKNEAIREFQEALRLSPGYTTARDNLMRAENDP